MNSNLPQVVPVYASDAAMQRLHPYLSVRSRAKSL
jgi:hypothetical protein